MKAQPAQPAAVAELERIAVGVTPGFERAGRSAPSRDRPLRSTARHGRSRRPSMTHLAVYEGRVRTREAAITEMRSSRSSRSLTRGDGAACAVADQRGKSTHALGALVSASSSGSHAVGSRSKRAVAADRDEARPGNARGDAAEGRRAAHRERPRLGRRRRTRAPAVEGKDHRADRLRRASC